MNNRKWYLNNRERMLAWKKSWYRKNPDKVKDGQLRIKFGISLVEYRKRLDDQNQLCAICGRHQSEFKRQFAVDYDHETGKLRSLLCAECNTALGKFKDSVLTLQRAVGYLQKWKELKEAA